jgi:hypothetical protein
MKSLKATASNRRFPRFDPAPQPTCPRCFSGMRPEITPVPRFLSQDARVGGQKRTIWRCKRAGCAGVVAGVQDSGVSESFRDKELRRAGKFLDVE